MKIYISIPITGQVEKARDHADVIKAFISRRGDIAVSPFDIYAGKHPEYADYLAADIRALLQCDGIFFASGWEESLGCNIEHDIVMRYKAFADRRGCTNFKVEYEL
jgi:hypothetical protein